MQYPVPQFTDVEDKIIGALTIKQFGIIFGAGVIVFLAYTATKSITVLIIFAVIVGIPALAIAFAKINGRPMYKMFPYVYNFMISPKVLVFHKEARNFSGEEKVKGMENNPQEQVITAPLSGQDRVKQINTILREKEEKEKELLRELR